MEMTPLLFEGPTRDHGQAPYARALRGRSQLLWTCLVCNLPCDDFRASQRAGAGPRRAEERSSYLSGAHRPQEGPPKDIHTLIGRMPHGDSTTAELKFGQDVSLVPIQSRLSAAMEQPAKSPQAARNGWNRAADELGVAHPLAAASVARHRENSQRPE